MKFFLKHCYGVLLLIAWFTAVSFWAYQQQGFSSFQEAPDGTLSFSCEQQCFLLLGALGGSDQLLVDGSISWEGQIGYWFLVGQQIYPGEVLKANEVSSLLFTFSTHPLYPQLPREATQVVVLADGEVNASALSVRLHYYTFGEKIAKGWKDFRTNEPLRPYSINLRYGVKVLGTPLVKIVYWIFIIGFLWSLFFVRGNDKRRTVLISLTVSLLVLFSARNLLNRTNRTSVALSTYTYAPEQEKTFYDLRDYPLFIDKMREKLSLDNKFGEWECTIYFDAAQEWPFKVHADRVYIKPCEAATDKNSTDYIVYYKKPIDPEYATLPVLLEFNWSFLIQNN